VKGCTREDRILEQELRRYLQIYAIQVKITTYKPKRKEY
jgi:hypothetical protein